MQVVHFNRKPRKYGNYSIEGFYTQIREALKDKIEFKVVECPYESNGFFKRFYNAIYAAFKQGEINHVTGDVNFLNLFFKKSSNIVTIHDCVLLDKFTGIKQQIVKLLWYSVPISRSKYVIAVSQSTKVEILKYVKCNPDKIKIIYNSISPIYVRFDKEFSKQKPVILHIGSSQNKNLLRLSKALVGLNCKLVIIGNLNPEDLNELANNTIEYENFVNITDEEVFEQYKFCDMLAFVSTYEGFGMPIVEANTVGRPVITSNLLSMPEVAGDAALIVNPYNIDEIRNGIIKIINDENYRNDLINKGYKNVKRFEMKVIADQYFKLYEEINK
jgi:glycosyltransferase involved in cell wall biosynthesis